jgi:hypothetical protein
MILQGPLVVADAESERRLRDLESRRELFECCAEVLMECECGRLILLEVVGYS